MDNQQQVQPPQGPQAANVDPNATADVTIPMDIGAPSPAAGPASARGSSNVFFLPTEQMEAAERPRSYQPPPEGQALNPAAAGANPGQPFTAQTITIGAAIKFDGHRTTGDYRPALDFITEWDNRGRMNSWPDSILLRNVEAHIEGEPKEWLLYASARQFFWNPDSGTPDPLRSSWPKFSHYFLQRYGDTLDTATVAWCDVFRQRRNEPAREYFTRVYSTAHKYFNNYGASITQNCQPRTVEIAGCEIAKTALQQVHANNPQQLQQGLQELATEIRRHTTNIGSNFHNASKNLWLREFAISGLARKETYEQAIALKKKGVQDGELIAFIEKFDAKFTKAGQITKGQHLRHVAPIAVAAIDTVDPEPTTDYEEGDLGAVFHYAHPAVEAVGSKAGPKPAPSASSGKASSAAGAPAKKKQVTCKFCKAKGHTIDECRKKKKADEAKRAAAVTHTEAITASVSGLSLLPASGNDSSRW